MGNTVKEIIANLTLEEKCALCAQADGSFGRVERLGLQGSVPQDNPRDGADYFRSGKGKAGDGKYHPVAFPSDAALAMSWDQELAKKTGEFFAMECRANPVLVNWLFRPGVNIKRSPLCGRNFEYFSEDPVQAGEMAGSYIQGLQEKGVAATLKHYIANNQEFERMTTNSVISERALREIYAKPFEVAIKKGNPWSVMSSYNQVNGEWVNSNQKVCDILRKEIGYEGVVVSDFAAVHHTKVEAHQCGMMDIELAPTCVHTEELLQAVKEGRISEETIDKGLTRVFELVEKLYEVEPLEVDMEELHEESRKACEQMIVLLKNDGILPLKENTKGLAVVGALAKDPSYMGGGSGHMCGYKVPTYLEAIEKVNIQISYADGYVLNPGFPPVEPVNSELVKEAVEVCQKADTIIVIAGLSYCYESEGYDRDNMLLPEGQIALLDALVKLDKKIILVLSCASVLDISRWVKNISAVVYNSLGGEAVASATTNVLFGKVNPSGKLAESWPICEEHTPAYTNFTRALKDMPDVIYGEDIYVGYRWYEKRKLPVLYPFGFGLSYTSFELGKPVFSKKEMGPGENIQVKVAVTNTGNREGAEVVQLYLSHTKPSIADHPVKELKSFAKVILQPGETKEVTLTIKYDDCSFYSPSQEKWIVEDGGYEVLIGNSSDNISYQDVILIKGGDKPYIYTMMTPLTWFMSSEKYHKILQENMSPEIDAMMHQETFEWCCLLSPLPFYKVTEALTGAPMMTKEQAQFVLDEMNK